MATLHDFHVYTKVTDGPRREELFDANRLVELDLKCQFTFAVSDESRRLQYFNQWKAPVAFTDGVTIDARILCAEPKDRSGKQWKVKVALMVKFYEAKNNSSSHFFTDEIIVWLDYNTDNRKGQPVNMRRFVEKCMRYHDRSDRNNPNGLWFTRHIARLPETTAETA